MMARSLHRRLTLMRMLGRIRNGFTETDKVLVTVSRLDPQKGVDLAIEALAHLDDYYKLLVVGTGVELPRLRELAGTLDVQDRVTFAGELGREDVIESLLAADAFVFPVRNAGREGLPMAVLEAVVAGLPTVVPVDSGWPEELLSALTFCDVENDKALASAMRCAANAEAVELPPSLALNSMAAAYARAIGE